jgi:hypothetical protein
VFIVALKAAGAAIAGRIESPLLRSQANGRRASATGSRHFTYLLATYPQLTRCSGGIVVAAKSSMHIEELDKQKALTSAVPAVTLPIG